MQHRLLLLLQLEQQRRDRVGRCAIEIAGRLIAQQQSRTANERARQRDTLFLAARELTRKMRHAMRQPDLIDQTTCVRVAAGIGWSYERRHEHVLEHAALRQQAVVLKHETDFLVAECREVFRRQAEWIHSAERHSPGRRRLERAEDIEKRALAASRRPHDGRGIAGCKRQRHIRQHRRPRPAATDTICRRSFTSNISRAVPTSRVHLEHAIGRSADAVVLAHAVETPSVRARRAARDPSTVCRALRQDSARRPARRGCRRDVFASISGNAPCRGCTTGTPHAIASSRNSPFGSTYTVGTENTSRPRRKSIFCSRSSAPRYANSPPRPAFVSRRSASFKIVLLIGREIARHFEPRARDARHLPESHVRLAEGEQPFLGRDSGKVSDGEWPVRRRSRRRSNPSRLIPSGTTSIFSRGIDRYPAMKSA